MEDWQHCKGLITQGYGVASGRGGNPRFPEGTLAMQKPFFAELGLDLDEYFLGTINLAIAPYTYAIRQAKRTFKNLKWSTYDPVEDFSFFDCRVTDRNSVTYSGLIYYPHPDTKPEHFQPADILEIIAPPIPDLQYGDELVLEVNPQQIEIYPLLHE